MAVLQHARAHPRLLIAAVAGVCAGLWVPEVHATLTRALFGWNVGVWSYLGSVAWMMMHADGQRLRRVAAAQAESALAVLMLVSVGATLSLIAIVFELSAAKAAGKGPALSHLVFVMTTVVGSWLLVPTLFALNYAAIFYTANGGLHFPEEDKAFHPDYADILYFSFTIAVASQTADVSITNRPMRRLVLLQSLLSFAFNTTILAFTINIAAGLF